MKPEEIKPDTKLCTILGYNAQIGYMRKYFNKILKLNNINATAIALNIKDEHFDITMSSVGQSKVTQMMIEKDFSTKALSYCEGLNDCAKREGSIDFIEVKDKKVYGYCLDDEAEALFDNKSFLDEQILIVAKMMLIAHRWFGAKVDIDNIPILIGDREDG
jgi:shikimate 5-dehydrogenase